MEGLVRRHHVFREARWCCRGPASNGRVYSLYVSDAEKLTESCQEFFTPFFNHPLPQSAWRDFTGSISMALQAGIRLASRATPATSRGTVAKVTGSAGDTPKS